MKTYANINNGMLGNKVIDYEEKKPIRGERKVMIEFYEPSIDQVASLMPNAMEQAIKTMPFDYKIGEENEARFISDFRYKGDLIDRMNEIKELKASILKRKKNFEDVMETERQKAEYKAELELKKAQNEPTK